MKRVGTIIIVRYEYCDVISIVLSTGFLRPETQEQSCVFLAGWWICWVAVGTRDATGTVDTRVPHVRHLNTSTHDPVAVHYPIGIVGRIVDRTGADFSTATGEAWDIVVLTIIAAFV